MAANGNARDVLELCYHEEVQELQCSVRRDKRKCTIRLVREEVAVNGNDLVIVFHITKNTSDPLSMILWRTLTVFFASSFYANTDYSTKQEQNYL